MNYDFDRIIDRRGSHSVKWEHIPYPEDAPPREDLIPLWIADMDFPCAEPIIRAMKDRADHGLFGYSSPNAEDYLTAVRGWFRRRFDWDFDAEAIQVAPGVVPALGVLLRALTGPGDGVLIQPPVYYPFSKMITANGRRVVANPLKCLEGRYLIDWEDLEKKVAAPETTMMILCSPHNPVGRVWTPEELERTARLCLNNGVILVSDEIHCDLVRRGKEHYPADKIVADDRIITCTSASKSFNLAGLQVSNIIIKNEEYRKKWQREYHEVCGLFGASPLSIAATIAAYNEGEPWLSQVIDYLDGNLAFIGEFLGEHLPRAHYAPSEGTYFAWLDLRDFGFSAEELEERMVRRGGVILDEGYIFGKEGRGFERINAACPRQLLKESLERMAAVLA